MECPYSETNKKQKKKEKQKKKKKIPNNKKNVVLEGWDKRVGGRHKREDIWGYMSTYS